MQWQIKLQNHCDANAKATANSFSVFRTEPSEIDTKRRQQGSLTKEGDWQKWMEVDCNNHKQLGGRCWPQKKLGLPEAIWKSFDLLSSWVYSLWHWPIILRAHQYFWNPLSKLSQSHIRNVFFITNIIPENFDIVQWNISPYLPVLLRYGNLILFNYLKFLDTKMCW